MRGGFLLESLMNLGVSIFPPIYDVEDILGLFTPLYTGNYKMKLTPSTQEEQTITYLYDTEMVSITRCLNPNRLSKFYTEDCIIVLHTLKSNEEAVLEHKGFTYTLEDYIYGIEKAYTTKLPLQLMLKNVEERFWLDRINKQLLMVLRIDNKELWKFQHQEVSSYYTGNTEYLFDFTKLFMFDGNTYYASLGIHLEYNDELEVEKLYTCTSQKEIEDTLGQCLKVNYNQKRFLKYLSDLSQDKNYASDVNTLELYCKALMVKVQNQHIQKAIIQ